MFWYVWLLIGVYALGVLVAFAFNMSMGMVTLGLTLVRSFLWPLWLFGLIPGERQ